jgi:hypothetical protein
VGRLWIAYHPEIDRSLLDHSVDFVGMSQVVVHRGQWTSLGEHLVKAGQIRQAHRVNRGDHDLASDCSRRVVSSSNIFDQSIELAKNAREPVEEFLPFGSHHKGPLGAVDKFHAKEFFEVLNALARSALRHAMFDRCMGKTSFSDHIEEDF